MHAAQNTLAIAGRILLGLYFLAPGVTKFTNYDATAQYMTDHGMVAVPFFLVATALIQIGGALCLFAGIWVSPVSFLLAGLVLVINIVMHDFWTMAEGIERAHEMQNFVKNMAILGGLLVLSGSSASLRRKAATGP